MKKIIAIQSNKLNEINIETDTTFLLALEAQKKYRETAISDTYTMIVPVSINTIFESI